MNYMSRRFCGPRPTIISVCRGLSHPHLCLRPVPPRSAESHVPCGSYRCNLPRCRRESSSRGQRFEQRQGNTCGFLLTCKSKTPYFRGSFQNSSPRRFRSCLTVIRPKRRVFKLTVSALAIFNPHSKSGASAHIIADHNEQSLNMIPKFWVEVAPGKSQGDNN